MTQDSITVAAGTDRENKIVRGVFWAEGEIVDHSSMQSVPEYHYHWLDSDGAVVGHGDHYLSEDHVKAAMQGVLQDFDADLPIEEGSPGTVDPRDAAMGRVSQTGSAHCLSCGGKLSPEAVHAVKRGASMGCPLCGTAIPKDGE